MNFLFQAHSGLRFLILLAGAIALVVYLAGQLQGQKFGKVHRIAGTAYAGLLHTQALLGLVMVALGRFYPALIGHLAMMLTAAVVMQVCLSVNKKRAQPGMLLPLVGTVISLLLIVGGVMAIGRGLFTVTPMGS